jgi:hypothetical protein
MAGLIVGVFIFFVILGFLEKMTLQDIIGGLIIGGVLFALGNLINIGWGIFGALLGVILATKNQKIIASVILAGIGFALGHLAAVGWGIFGAVLGELIGFSSTTQTQNA